jgi:hypothetical protein
MEEFRSPLERVSKVAKEILLEKPVTTYDKIQRGVFPEGVVVHLGPRCIRLHREKLLTWLAAGGDKTDRRDVAKKNGDNGAGSKVAA